MIIVKVVLRDDDDYPVWGTGATIEDARTDARAQIPDGYTPTHESITLVDVMGETLARLTDLEEACDARAGTKPTGA